MFEKVGKTRQITVTPQKAAELLELNDLHYQRPIRQRHVEFFSNKLKNGLLLDSKIVVASRPEGTDILIDGQHRCSACVHSGIAFKADIAHYFCPTPEDISLLFSNIDPAISARTLTDMGAIEAHVLGVDDWGSRVVSLVVGAATIIRKKTHAMPDEKVLLLREFTREGDFVNAILSSGMSSDARILKRRSVVAVMIVTWQSCQSDAKFFWPAVRDGDMLGRKDPEFLLRRFLLERHTNVGNNGIPKKYLASEHEFMYRCVAAWNAFREDKKISIIKYFPSADIPRVK